MPKGIYFHKQLSEETKTKISIARKGKKRPSFSEKWKERISTSLKKIHPIGMRGKKHTKEAKIKISKFGKGRIPWNKNKKFLQVTKEKNPNWKGGITPINAQARNSLELKNWRKLVFERDGYICKKCNKKNTYLQAHHIQNFSENLELRFVISNGITFCKNCHKLFHMRFGRKNNNSEQINFYLSLKPGIIQKGAPLYALKNQYIAGAAVDFIDDEELVKFSRISDRLILTNHIGGCTFEDCSLTKEFILKKIEAYGL